MVFIIGNTWYCRRIWLYDELSPLAAIRQSKVMMRGYKLDFFILNLSFIGWAILAVFTFGILYFWLLPYMNVTYAKFYDMVKKHAQEAK